MTNTKSRLELSAALLAVIEQHRTATGDPELGAGLERFITEEDCRDLDRDIVSNPGALESQLLPVLRTKALRKHV